MGKIAMKVFVNNNGPSPVNVSADETVASLKSKLEVSDDASLSFAGQILQNEVSLLSAGVCELSTLSVSCELIGGKVHGSLARAGKVKGQKLRLVRKKRRKLEEPLAGNNTTENLSMLLILLGRQEDPTQMLNNFC